jgi:GST-like protein
MLGQNHHFSHYAPEKIPYAIDRYRNETHRLYGVLDKRLADRDFIAGEISIVDFACIGWAKLHERQGIDRAEFPRFGAWLDRMLARPGVERGLALAGELRLDLATDEDAKKVLFGQRAR